MIPSHLQNRSIDQLRSTQETIRCFLVQPTGEGYESVIVTEDGKCVGEFDYHRSEKVISRFSLGEDDTYPEWKPRDNKSELALNYCLRCGNHNFSPEALKKASGSMGRVWERVDTGERADNLNAFGPGAMWFLTWYKGDNGLYSYTGTNEPPICVRTPGGDWVIDSRCSNCTMPDDNVHKCWPRRGVVPNITVDKSFGNTCSAGGGSIITGNGQYHGFLRDGYLIKC